MRYGEFLAFVLKTKAIKVYDYNNKFPNVFRVNPTAINGLAKVKENAQIRVTDFKKEMEKAKKLSKRLKGGIWK